MKKDLINFCNLLNIENVGITDANPHLEFAKCWSVQISKDYISGFEEKDEKKRIYPKLTLPEAKSIIVCLFPFFAGEVEQSNLPKDALSIDYHLIIKEKLEKISMFLKSNLNNFTYKCFVDNGPLNDRYLAYKSGLGFLGVNSHIITKKYGSYVFIGYILNNHPFEPDAPSTSTCYNCLRCLKSCPGQCILENNTINAKKCRSYITQKKNALSDSEVEILKKGSSIWGCTICQDVCPHNKEVKKTPIKEFKENLINHIDYDEIKIISNKEFMRRYKNRSFSWRGKKVLERNFEYLRD